MNKLCPVHSVMGKANVQAGVSYVKYRKLWDKALGEVPLYGFLHYTAEKISD